MIAAFAGSEVAIVRRPGELPSEWESHSFASRPRSRFAFIGIACGWCPERDGVESVNAKLGHASQKSNTTQWRNRWRPIAGENRPYCYPALDEGDAINPRQIGEFTAKWADAPLRGEINLTACPP
jgi:hypothetical protein